MPFTIFDVSDSNPVQHRLAAAQALNDITLQVVVCVEHALPSDAIIELLEDRADIRFMPINHLATTKGFWHNEAEADALVIVCPVGGLSTSTIAVIEAYLQRESVPPALAIFYESIEDAQYVRACIKHHAKNIIPLLPTQDVEHGLAYTTTASINAWFEDVRFDSTALRRNRIRWLQSVMSDSQSDDYELGTQVQKYIAKPISTASKEVNEWLQARLNKGKWW